MGGCAVEAPESRGGHFATLEEGFRGATAAGDFDGDGRTDMVLGAPGEPGLARVAGSAGGGGGSDAGPRAADGVVVVLHGTQNGLSLADTLAAPSGQARFGHAVVVADFDGDGLDDLAVGAPARGEGVGTIVLYRGSPSGLVAWTTLVEEGESSVGGGLGLALAAVDLDGDGVPELLAGQPLAERETRVFEASGEDWTERAAVSIAWSIEEHASDARAVASALVARTPGFAIPWEDMTALQRHVSFFDWNADGIVTVAETYLGLRALALGPVSSATFAAVINGALATPSAGELTLDIEVAGIARTIHGSDSDIYEEGSGELDPVAFDRFFDRWDRNRDDALDALELSVRLAGEAQPFDVFGIAASGAEWGLLWVVAQENGALSRDRLRSFYDGSLFFVLAAEREWLTRWWPI